MFLWQSLSKYALCYQQLRELGMLCVINNSENWAAKIFLFDENQVKPNNQSCSELPETYFCNENLLDVM